MSIKDLIPWNRGKKEVAALEKVEASPIVSLEREMNRIFEEFHRGFGLSPFARQWEGFGGFTPGLNMVERDREVEVKVELPGMDEKDIDIAITHDQLTIKGEKKEEKENKGEGYYHRECSYGAFHRSLPLPRGIDEEKVSASFQKGVLTIILPKTEEARKAVKKIPVTTG